jgi:hypothetical protein
MRILWVLMLSVSLAAAAQSDVPAANPGRPTVTNTALLPPVGYVQFEQGYMGSLGSPTTGAQYGAVSTWRTALSERTLVEEQVQPVALTESAGASSVGLGDVLLGVQRVVFVPWTGAATGSGPAKTPVPTGAVAYLGRVHTGTTGDTDQGSVSHSVNVLLSGDIGAFHYDTNYLANVQPGEAADGSHSVRRVQYAQTLSVNHGLLNPNLQVALEVYHFTQPLVTTDDDGRPLSRANLVDALVAFSYTVWPNLVIDGGCSRGLTSSSTEWQSFAGFTYLLPRRLWPGGGVK